MESSLMLFNLEKLDMGHVTESILNILAAPAPEMATEGLFLVWCEMSVEAAPFLDKNKP